MIGGVDAEVASYIDGCTAADLKEKCIQLGLLSSRETKLKVAMVLVK